MSDTLTPDARVKQAERAVSDLTTRYNELVDEHNTLARSANLTDGQRTRYNDIGRAMEKLEPQIRDAERELDEARFNVRRSNDLGRLAQYGAYGTEQATFDAPNQIRRSNPWESPDRLRPDELVDRAKAAVEITHDRYNGVVGDDTAARLDGLLRVDDGEVTSRAAQWSVISSDPAYLAAFAKLVRDPVRGHLGFDDLERAAYNRAEMVQRAMTVGTDTAGGALAPFVLDPSIILSSSGSVNPMRQVARVATTVSKTWNGVTSAGVTASWDAEAAEVSDDSPTLAEVQIDVHKGAAFVPFSFELAQDGIDFFTEMSRLLRDSIDQLQAAAHVTGTGSGQPQGFQTGLDGTASEIAPTTAETFAAADVYKLIEAVPPRFRPNAAWLAALGTMNDIAQFETGNGARLFPSIDDGRLLMKPAYECSNMDSSGDINAAATADNFVLAAGDWQQGYILVDRIGTTIELIPHLVGGNQRPTGQRGLYCYFRHGAEVVNTAALRVLSIPTTA